MAVQGMNIRLVASHYQMKSNISIQITVCIQNYVEILLTGS